MKPKTMNHNLRTRTITQNFPLLLHVMMMHLKDEEETAHNVSTISQYQSYAKENYFIFSICKRLKSLLSQIIMDFMYSGYFMHRYMFTSGIFSHNENFLTCSLIHDPEDMDNKKGF